MKALVPKSLLAVMLFLCWTSAFSQRKCGSADHLKEQLLTDPAFAAKHQQIEEATEEYIKKGGSKGLTQRGTALYNIPVVVHVIWNTTAQNITDAQIQSQIDVLNKDYQLNNSDTNSVPSVFRPYRADCKIQFCLAKRDPSGNSTTGIIRKQSTTTTFTTNDAVKSNATGGDDPWNSTQYLNLWVCNLSGGILGYSQFPGGNAATDGVVIQYTAFGTTGTATSPFNLGRTTTHEVGHWLNLIHIWGDDGTACTGTDNVGDTPNQGAENYGCPMFPKISCSNGPNGDMFMNFMDYVDDRCMMMFSLGQRDRIYAVLQTGGARAALATSQGCVAPATTTCAVPSGETAGSITTTGATISWGAATGAASYNLQYKKSSASSFISVLGIKTTSYALTGLTAATAYNYKVSTTCSGTSSAYSSVYNFTTQSATTACSDNYEPNNSLTAAVTIPVNTNIVAFISGKTDYDYYKFNNTSTSPNITINLTNLPADYDMKLYNSAGTLLKTSSLRGTTNESIVYNTSTIGTYIVYVYGYSGAYNATKCYTLNAGTSSTLTRSARLEGSTEDMNKTSVKIYPSPASNAISLCFSGYDERTTEVAMMSGTGEYIMHKQLKNTYGNAVAEIDVSTLPSGIYFIKTKQGDKTNLEKVYVHH